MRELAMRYTVLDKLIDEMIYLKMVAAAFVAALAWVLPSEALHTAGLVAFGLVMLDTFTGAWCAWINSEVNSRKFSRVVSKLIAYASLLLVCRSVSLTIPGMSDLGSLSVGACLGLVIMTESISILENIRKLGFTLPFGLEDALLKRLRAAAHEERPPTDNP